MNRSFAVASAVTAVAALMPAQVNAQVQAAKACLSEREIAQMMVYAVPAVVDGVKAKCAKRLSSTGFLATQGTAFSAKYAALQNETWPSAKSAIIKFAGGKTGTAKGSDPLAQLAALPDSAVRPLVDAMIAQKIGETIKLPGCANVERGMQLASVLNPRDGGALLAFVVAMAKPKDPPICPAQS